MKLWFPVLLISFYIQACGSPPNSKEVQRRSKTSKVIKDHDLIPADGNPQGFWRGNEANEIEHVLINEGYAVLKREDFEHRSIEPAKILARKDLAGTEALIVSRGNSAVLLVDSNVFRSLKDPQINGNEDKKQKDVLWCSYDCGAPTTAGAIKGILGGAAAGAGIGGAISGPAGAGAGAVIGGTAGGVAGAIEAGENCAKDKAQTCGGGGSR